MTDSTVQRVSDEDFVEIRQQVHDFVRDVVVPRETEIDENDAIPDDVRKAAAEMGLFGYAIPQQYGGLGLDVAQDAELAMELGYTTLAFRSMFGTNNGIAGQVLVGYGTEAQKQRWLESMADGRCIASFALTEPGAGSDPSSVRTTATWSQGRWTLDGSKRYITNAPVADLFVTFARVRGTGESEGKIAVFLVPADSPGISVGPRDKKMGQAGAMSAEVYFQGVELDETALVSGDVQTGFRAAMSVLARGRVHISALAMGTAQRALDESVTFSAINTQGAIVTGDQQLVQAMLAEQQSLVMAGKALVREAAASYRDGTDRRIAPSAAKLFCTEAACKVADLAVQTHGGSGYMRGVTVERIYRDIRLLRLYEGTSEIQKLIIGRELIRVERERSSRG